MSFVCCFVVLPLSFASSIFYFYCSQLTSFLFSLKPHTLPAVPVWSSHSIHCSLGSPCFSLASSFSFPFTAPVQPLSFSQRYHQLFPSASVNRYFACPSLPLASSINSFPSYLSQHTTFLLKLLPPHNLSAAVSYFTSCSRLPSHAETYEGNSSSRWLCFQMQESITIIAKSFFLSSYASITFTGITTPTTTVTPP